MSWCSTPGIGGIMRRPLEGNFDFLLSACQEAILVCIFSDHFTRKVKANSCTTKY